MPYFTSKYVENLKPRANRYEVYSTGEAGFGIRVSPNGIKTWISRYKLEGKTRKHTHGTTDKYSLLEARLLHQSDRIAIRQGKDPQHEALLVKIREKQAITAPDLYEEFKTKHLKDLKRPEYPAKLIEKNVLPYWQSLKVKDITRADIKHVLNKITSRGSKVVANRTGTYLRQMLAYAEREQYIERSPYDLKRKEVGGKEKSRDRYLSRAELTLFWNNLDSTAMALPLRLALRLLLLLGQRRGELAAAEKTEFELDGNRPEWVIPSHKTKNSTQHIVPLPPLAVNYLQQLFETSGDSNYILPTFVGHEEDDLHIDGRTLTRAVSRNLAKFGIGKFTPHDLRRTASTHWPVLGVTNDVIDKILNHKEQGVIKVYNVYDYYDEKRDALCKWCDYIEELVNEK
jgi:integrase